MPCRHRASSVGEGSVSRRTPIPVLAPQAPKQLSVFHFTGSFGVSEAHGASVASVLKKSSSFVNQSAVRVIEKAVLRVGGLAGDSSDDPLLRRFACLGRLSFHSKYSRRRCRQFRAGLGSKPLHRFLTAATSSKLFVRKEVC